MARDELLKGRVSLAHQIYHITTCTHERQPIFNNFDYGRLLVTEISRLQQEGKVLSLAWVVMPDHLHWLLQLKENSHLSQVIKELKARSAVRINRQHGQKGNLWQKGFHDHAIREDEELIETARYIIANPLRAGLVSHIGSYSLWDTIWL
ncbi:transposase [Moraxellaceae bacterium AER2_44_116]|nr:transposase [Moraxellaceae bacterium]TQC98372.1 transposase [Moraxellaceae bacterium AER2_44_116]